MRRFTGTLINSLGVPQTGASVQVVLAGTMTPAALFDASGNVLTNPLTTDINGQYGFNVRSGVYDVLDVNNNKLISQVQIFDFTTINEWPSGGWNFPGTGIKIGGVAISDDGLGNMNVGGATTATTVGAAGGGSAPPATPVTYWKVLINGTIYKIPLYNP